MHKERGQFLCILHNIKNVDGWPWRFRTTKFENELLLSKYYSTNYQSLLLITLLIIIPITISPAIACKGLVKRPMIIFGKCHSKPKTIHPKIRTFIINPFDSNSYPLVPQIPPNSLQYPKKFFLCIIHCCTSLFLTPLLIQWIFFIHSI